MAIAGFRMMGKAKREWTSSLAIGTDTPTRHRHVDMLGVMSPFSLSDFCQQRNKNSSRMIVYFHNVKHLRFKQIDDFHIQIDPTS